ncbi:MAG: hypothetical protein ACPG5P_04905 [Saprospiraceae bacterium]
MNIHEYINAVFEKITESFPNVGLAYQYNTFSETHFFRFDSDEIFNSNEFVDLDFELTELFDENDFEGLVCFITLTSLTQLDNPMRIYQGLTGGLSIDETMNTNLPVAEEIDAFNFSFQSKEVPFVCLNSSAIFTFVDSSEKSCSSVGMAA